MSEKQASEPRVIPVTRDVTEADHEERAGWKRHDPNKPPTPVPPPDKVTPEDEVEALFE
jgi:hypothetical protein